MTDLVSWGASAIAGYGAIVSTYTVVSRHRERQSELARGITVTPRSRIIPGDPPYAVLAIHAYNSGRRPVEIVRAGLKLVNGMGVWHGPETAELPALLGDGQSVEIRLPPDWIDLVTASAGEPERLAVTDAGGTIYLSEPLIAPTSTASA